MTLQVIPAIDLAGGRLVTTSTEGVRPLGAFGGSPVAAARAFADVGAERLHVVDVDRAHGGGADLGLLRELVAVGLPVQASGGIVTRSHVEEALAAGAERVVLGSGMLADRELVEGLLRELGPAVVIGVEADGDVLRPRSAGAVELPLPETLEWTRSIGALRYLLTGVGRVGRLGGPDLGAVRALAEATGRPVLVAGGIRGIDDLVALAALGGTVDGAVVGRALYEGLGLREALVAVDRDRGGGRVSSIS